MGTARQWAFFQLCSILYAVFMKMRRERREHTRCHTPSHRGPFVSVFGASVSGVFWQRMCSAAIDTFPFSNSKLAVNHLLLLSRLRPICIGKSERGAAHRRKRTRPGAGTGSRERRDLLTYVRHPPQITIQNALVSHNWQLSRPGILYVNLGCDVDPSLLNRPWWPHRFDPISSRKDNTNRLDRYGVVISNRCTGDPKNQHNVAKKKETWNRHIVLVFGIYPVAVGRAHWGVIGKIDNLGDDYLFVPFASPMLSIPFTPQCAWSC